MCTQYVSVNIRQPFKGTLQLSTLSPASVLSVHSKLMDVCLFSLFLKSIDKLLTIIQYNHNIFILLNIRFFFFLFCFVLFFSILSIVMCVRVCCLASVGLLRWNVVSMKQRRARSLFQAHVNKLHLPCSLISSERTSE